MTKLITVYWRDIPAQVIARTRGETAKVKLSQRFEVAIDRAAMRAGKGGSAEYLEGWRRESAGVDGGPGTAAAARAEDLERAYDDARLERLVKAGGAEPT